MSNQPIVISPIVSKKCSKCGGIKQLDDFYIDKTRKKERYQCKECDKKARKTYYHKNPRRENAKNKKWREENKIHLQQYQQNNREKRSQGAKNWYNLNKEHRLILSRKWNQKNPEKRKETYHRRRSRKQANGGSFTWKEFEELCILFGSKCLSCGRVNIKLTPDHVIPLALGGSNSIVNIQPLCISCNSSKNIKTTDFRKGLLYG